MKRGIVFSLSQWESNGVRRQARQACVRLIPLLGESNCVGASRVRVRGLPPTPPRPHPLFVVSLS